MHGKVRVEVFSGSVELATPLKTVKLGKDKVLEFDPEATEVAFEREAGNRQGFLGQVDVRARYPIAAFARGPRRPGARPALWLERSRTLTANGDTSPVSAMAGRLSRRRAGRPTAWGCGAGTRAWVTRGLPASPGAGCLITTAIGISPPASAGFGCPAALTLPGPRHWLVGIRGRDGLAGRHWAWPGAGGTANRDHRPGQRGPEWAGDQSPECEPCIDDSGNFDHAHAFRTRSRCDALRDAAARECGRVAHPPHGSHAHIGALFDCHGRRRGKRAIVARRTLSPPTAAGALGNNLGWAICRGRRGG